MSIKVSPQTWFGVFYQVDKTFIQIEKIPNQVWNDALGETQVKSMIQFKMPKHLPPHLNKPWSTYQVGQKSILKFPDRPMTQQNLLTIHLNIYCWCKWFVNHYLLILIKMKKNIMVLTVQKSGPEGALRLY